MDESLPGPSNSNQAFCLKPSKITTQIKERVKVTSSDLEELVKFTLYESDDEIDDSDKDPDYEEESDHDTESEQSSTDNYEVKTNKSSFDKRDKLKPQSQIQSNASVRDATKTLVQSNKSGDTRDGSYASKNGEEQLVITEEEFYPEETYVEGETDAIESNTEYNIETNHVNDVIEEVIQNTMALCTSQTVQRGDQTYFYGRRNKDMIKKNIPAFKWKKKQTINSATRTRRENIITQLPGLRAKARDLGENPDIDAVWSLLFSPDMLNEIIEWTNEKIHKIRPNYSKKNLAYVHDTDIVELKGFIGLLVYASVFKSGNESVLSMFATDGTGREIFRCVMSKERFLFLMNVLRFDNPDDRAQRKTEDKAAAISKIFSQFIHNCQECYTPGAFLCADEMLVPFRGRSSFRMYMPKKPARYGIKVMCITDAKTHYLLNAYIYTGQGSYGKTLTTEEMKFAKPTQSVLRLAKPYLNTGRNITADNWFSSVQLAKELLQRKTTYIGTMKKNKIEVPIEFLPDKNRVEKSALYGYTEDLTLVSYVPKVSKAVLLISSMHHEESVDENIGKPEIIAEYNRTKGGVDSVDQMCSNYCCSRRTKRWPMAIFFTIVNLSAGVNSYILHQAYKNTKRMTRLDFMKELGKSLVAPLMHRRLSNKHIGNDLASSIRRILNVPAENIDTEETNVFEKRKTCAICPPKLKRKTKYPCELCRKPICLECAKKICRGCLDEKKN